MLECALMKERSIGMRELKSKLSECVREVKKGATIVVTDHGHRVARIIPETQTLEERLDALRNAGAVHWSGRRPETTMPDLRPRGQRSVADIVVENR
jgi:prevent-host-death family protein